MGNFQPLEVVNRAGETQDQVVEILNKITSGIMVNSYFKICLNLRTLIPMEKLVIFVL